MASLGSHSNVYNTCLLILQQRGYKLSTQDMGDTDAWCAEKDGYTFMADNPIELLGLTAVYEFKAPTAPPVSYWWVVEGEDLFERLRDEGQE